MENIWEIKYIYNVLYILTLVYVMNEFTSEFIYINPLEFSEFNTYNCY